MQWESLPFSESREGAEKDWDQNYPLTLGGNKNHIILWELLLVIHDHPTHFLYVHIKAANAKYDNIDIR